MWSFYEKDIKFIATKYFYHTIGYGIFAKKSFEKCDFLLFYPGEEISEIEGKNREKSYAIHLGSYLFFDNKKW